MAGSYYYYFFKDNGDGTGSFLAKQGNSLPLPADKLESQRRKVADENGLTLAEVLAHEIQAGNWPYEAGSNLSATIEAGSVTAVEVVAEAVLPEIFLHLGIDAPGTGPTGTPSVAMGETATLTAAMRETAAEDAAVVPYSGTVRAPYYQNGAYHGELRMVFAAGLCTLAFSPQPHNHGKLTVNEDEIGELNGYKIRVVGSTELIVDQVSAA